MRKILFILLLLTTGLVQAQESFNLLSYNVRYNNPNDGENAWPNRYRNVTGLIQFHKAAIVCTQEVLHGQLQDMLNELTGWKYVGVGRDDGKQAGEYSAILYNARLFGVEEHGTFWLNETLEKPTTGWDAVCIRICTWAKMKRKADGQKFYLFNTHFDHEGKQSQQESARLIVKKIKELAHGKLPVLLTGDFNITPENKAIANLKKQLNDSREITRLPPYGPEGTYNAFDFNHPLDSRIDYVFVNRNVKVLRYGVLSDSKNRRYYSDHLPVLVEVSF